MLFKVDLSRVSHFSELPVRYTQELDDVCSIIMDICEALADTSSAEFIVSGFGQERWPVDVRVDLSVFLEQLPNAVAAVGSGASFSLDFYEQGIERVVHFEPDGDRYAGRCESQTEWKPAPAIEMIDRLVLMRMLSDVREELMRFLSRNAPNTAGHPWMRDWAGAAPE